MTHSSGRRGEKKTALSAPADTKACSASTLVDAYEQLRRDATVAGGHGTGLHGFVIVARKGLAAWMRASAAAGISAPPTTTVSPLSAMTRGVPGSVQREVINVLAAMALTTMQEMRA